MSYKSDESPYSPHKIIDVWDSNFITEIRKISQLIADFPIISFVFFEFMNLRKDTEFPGIVDNFGNEIINSPVFFNKNHLNIVFYL